MINRVATLFSARQALLSLAHRDIKLKYAGHGLGGLWNIIYPLYFLALYTVIFGTLLKVRFGATNDPLNFVLYFLAAFIPWLYFQEAVSRGITAFSDNSQMIKKSNLPMEIYMFLPLVSTLVTLLFSFFFFFLLLIFLKKFYLFSFFYIWIPLLVEIFLAAGMIIIFATLNTFFRDISQAVSVALSTLFFLTPIVYPANIIPERLMWIFRLNPIYWLVESFRAIIIKGDPAGIKLLVFPFSVAIFSFVLGYFLFLRTEEAIKDIL